MTILPRDTVNSLLTDTSIRRTPGVGPVSVVFSYFTVTKLSIKRTPLLDGQVHGVGPDGVRFRES